MRRGSELSDETRVRGAAQGRSVEGVDVEVDGRIRWVGGEVCDKGRDSFGGLSWGFWWRVVVDLGSEEVEDMFEGEGRGVAVYYKNPGRVGGVARIQVVGEGGDELAF